VCGFGCLGSACLALRSLALCMFVRLHLAFVPAGGPFLPFSLLINEVLQRGTRDTPKSMGAERQRAEAKHKQTQATHDTLTRDRPQTHPHKSAKATGKQATADLCKYNLQRETVEKVRHPETKPGANTLSVNTYIYIEIQRCIYKVWSDSVASTA
jgi:membrane-bound lytic murein transglycosylase B